MAITTTKYQRNPIIVDAILVTEENFEEIAKWCDGTIVNIDNEVVNGEGTRFIKVRVHNPQRPRQTKAFVGDWILYSDYYGYKVYTENAFRNSFQPMNGKGQGTPAEKREQLEAVAEGK